MYKKCIETSSAIASKEAIVSEYLQLIRKPCLSNSSVLHCDIITKIGWLSPAILNMAVKVLLFLTFGLNFM